MTPTRIKHTFLPPHVCIDCYWETRVKAQVLLNKQLRTELLKFTNAKRNGRKAEPEPRERDDDRSEVPDLLDEMSNMGKIKLDD